MPRSRCQYTTELIDRYADPARTPRTAAAIEAAADFRAAAARDSIQLSFNRVFNKI